MPIDPMMTKVVKVQPAPPLPELVLEVGPLAIEEALPDIAEVQSLTLMIQGVLDKLAPEEGGYRGI